VVGLDYNKVVLQIGPAHKASVLGVVESVLVSKRVCGVHVGLHLKKEIYVKMLIFIY
jgi:hypothetical protein